MVVGGIAKVGQNYKIGSYLVNIHKGTVCPMQKIEFDPDLLGASVEVFNMASDMVKKIEGCPNPIKAPFRVVQTAVKKKTRIKAVAVGPAVPPPETQNSTNPQERTGFCCHKFEQGTCTTRCGGQTCTRSY